jgi:corrinoid protein of di/trimethylamine methyltransferase
MAEDKILEKLQQAVIDLDEALSCRLAEEALKANLDPVKAVDLGLVKGLDVVGERFERDEIFLPELMMAANAFQAAMKILEPEIRKRGLERAKKGAVVLGTVKGDIHKIGKDIVALLLGNAGFEVHNLGEDVDLFAFLSSYQKFQADAIGLSALLTSTLSGQKDVIDALSQEGLRQNCIVMVGGGAVTPEWATACGADFHGENAQAAVRKLNEKLKEE